MLFMKVAALQMVSTESLADNLAQAGALLQQAADAGTVPGAWVDHDEGGEKRTRGGSWWYGAASMRDGHRQSKPRNTAVVYIGFRCVR